jgi:hypothetical protein
MRLPTLLFVLAMLVVNVACDSATAQTAALATGTRSAVAGTWSVTESSSARIYHLTGTDLELSGAWTNYDGSYGSGRIQGDFASGVLRLHKSSTSSGSEGIGLIDCVVATDGNSATGVSYSYAGTTYPVTMTRLAPPTP